MIKTSNIAFAYSDQKKFNFPDIDMTQGEQALLIGGSGCGKSTYMNILSGLAKPVSGNAIVANQDLSQLNANRLDVFRGAQIGIIFQEAHLIDSLSIKQNFMWRLKLANKEFDAGYFEKLISKLSLEGLLKQKPKQLSFGERQRCNIALALMAKPAVILADEPTSALDDANAQEVISLLTELSSWNNSTLLIITHDQRVKDSFINHIEL